MYKEGTGYRLGTSQVYTKGQAKLVVGFKQRALQEHADALWIIRTHLNENEARADETITSLQYGLPTLPFVPRKGKGTNGLVHDPIYIRRVYQTLDTTNAAMKLLDDVGLDPERPHHLPQGRNSNRRNIVITLCGDRRGGNPMHRISIVGVSATDRRALQALGLSVRPAKAGSRSWRFETVRSDFGELMAIARSIKDKLGARYILQGHVLERSLPFITASSIRPGMVMATESGGFNVVEEITFSNEETPVYDLNIDRTHNFIANGIVTHNSIYSWRGARVENMQRFRKDFSETRLLRLEQNYRSTANILNAANTLIANNNARLGKQLWTEGEAGEQINLYTAYNEQDEARYVVDQIGLWRSRHGRYSDCAVLYRVSAQSRVLEEVLMRANIPYRVYGGMRFYERAEIKDALAYLRLATFQDDDASFERIINTPPRGVGERTIDEIRTVAKRDQCSLWAAAGQLLQHKLLSARALNSVGSFLQLIRQIHDSGEGLPLDGVLDNVIKHSGLIEHFKKEKGERGLARVENLEELVTAAGEFEMADDEQEAMTPLHAFLAHAALESGETQAGDSSDCAHLMTLHAAKGLEFQNVFLVGMEEGLFPHQRSSGELRELEEERRLCYVGITRARKSLTLTHALHRRLYGSDFYSQPSRFIQELPPGVINTVRLGSDAMPRSLFNATSGSAETTGFALGQRVLHAKFGEGVILNLEGSGPNARIQVNFEKAGSKWLVAGYANLRSETQDVKREA
jgi:DNA helicase-2/ATP-dependent DNA helicase PcrA